MSLQTLDPDLKGANRELELLQPQARIRWAIDLFGDKLVLSSSFGVQAAVLLHMVTREKPDIPVIFIDTGYHFPETYLFVETLRQRLELNLHVYQPLITAARQETLYGKRWEMGAPGIIEYNKMNKVEPMNRALNELGAHAWITGLRREQSSTREQLDYLALQGRTYKCHPILEWSNRDIYNYLRDNELPYHPLWEKGYVSIGDWHSTSPLMPGMSESDTRFNGIRRECGLHEVSGQSDWQI